MTETGQKIYLGTMSGTSMDGLDLVAVTFDDHRPRLLCQQNTAYPPELKSPLQAMVLDSSARINEMCELDTLLGQFYAQQINRFIDDNRLCRSNIVAIGSHGQTLRHSITTRAPYTLQIGDPNIIAARTGLTVVADFRRRDLAFGGQGAPLAPAFHQLVFHSSNHERIIINIGGIANITHLPGNSSEPVTGFDSGPGNTLMDSYCQRVLQQNYDQNGDIARKGQVHAPTLKAMLNDAYFHQSPPKSTGTDYFSTDWTSKFEIDQLSRTDALATLTELTAQSLAQAILSLGCTTAECFVCGGGAHNNFLLERLAERIKPWPVKSSAVLGIHPDWVEAMAFAWLAHQTLQQLPGNLPSVTKAQNSTILGGVYFSHEQSGILC